MGCNSNNDNNNGASSDTSEVSINVKPFGVMPDGKEVNQYILTNANGVEMSVINYGGIITSLKVPDKNGNIGDVVLGYDNLDSYLENNPYFGAIIGRYGNRIAKGKFSLGDSTYSLATNNLGNHLHGGNTGFDKVFWDAYTFRNEEGVGVRLSYVSADMEEGYPGQLTATVTYLLDNNDALTFDYSAETDKKTIVNLTQHSYFNLSGKDDILDHKLMLNAPSYLPVDSTLIPTGEMKPVEGTPFNFLSLQAIGKDIDEENRQLEIAGGYDHCWVLNKEEGSMSLAATLHDPESGRKVEVYTTEPGIQFYSGNFLDGSITGKDNKAYGYRSGLCLETQHYPDSPNQPNFPSVALYPGETYRSTTKFQFSNQ